MERVSVREGSVPIVVVAPHGPDDDRTAIIAADLADRLDAFAVINNGWCRSEAVDYMKDLANCNNVEHLQEDVVREEFLEPVITYTSRIQSQLLTDATVVLIHGMSNQVKVDTGDDVDVVVGYGASKKDTSLSCDPVLLDVFLYLCVTHNMVAYKGAAGGKYAGAQKNNLNQYWRRWDMNPHVHSLQLELVYDLRCETSIAKYTAEVLGNIFGDYAAAVDRAELDEGFDHRWRKIAAARPSF